MRQESGSFRAEECTAAWVQMDVSISPTLNSAGELFEASLGEGSGEGRGAVVQQGAVLSSELNNVDNSAQQTEEGANYPLRPPARPANRRAKDRRAPSFRLPASPAWQHLFTRGERTKQGFHRDRPAPDLGRRVRTQHSNSLRARLLRCSLTGPVRFAALPSSLPACWHLNPTRIAASRASLIGSTTEANGQRRRPAFRQARHLGAGKGADATASDSALT